MLVLRGLLAEYDAVHARQWFHGRQAACVDIRVDAAEMAEQAVATEVSLLDLFGISVEKGKQVRKVLCHEGAQCLVVPKTVLPVRVLLLPTSRIPDRGWNVGTGPHLMDNARNCRAGHEIDTRVAR